MATRPKPPPPAEYARRMRAMRPFVKTSIRARKHFTPQQKAAITRQWKKIGGLIRNERQGVATFKPLKPRELRSLKGDNYAKTAKGVFVKGRVESVSYKAPVTPGDQSSLAVQYAGSDREDQFFAAPANVVGAPDFFMAWAFETIKSTGAEFATFTIHGKEMQRTFDISEMYAYDTFDEYLDNADDEFAAYGQGIAGMATGVVAVFQ